MDIRMNFCGEVLQLKIVKSTVYDFLYMQIIRGLKDI